MVISHSDLVGLAPRDTMPGDLMYRVPAALGVPVIADRAEQIEPRN
jgi:hypothetical protein